MAGSLYAIVMGPAGLQTPQTPVSLQTFSLPGFLLGAAVLLLLTRLDFGTRRIDERLLKITIPENLDYDGLFDDLLDTYTTAHTLERVKTANMGTLYELQYRVTLRDAQVPKAFLDALRCRNGNLNIICGRETDKDSI